MLIFERNLRLMIKNLLLEGERSNFDLIKRVSEESIEAFKRKSKRLIRKLVRTAAKRGLERKDRASLHEAIKNIDIEIKVVQNYRDYMKEAGKGKLIPKKDTVGAFYLTQEGTFIENLIDMSEKIEKKPSASESDIEAMLDNARKIIKEDDLEFLGTIVIGVDEVLKMYGPVDDKFAGKLEHGLIGEELFHMYDHVIRTMTVEYVRKKGKKAYSIDRAQSGKHTLRPDQALTDPISKDILSELGIKEIIPAGFWSGDKKKIAKMMERSFKDPDPLEISASAETIERKYYDKLIPSVDLIRNYSELYVGLSEFKKMYGTRGKVDEFFKKHIGKGGHDIKKMGAKFTGLHIIIDRSKLSKFKKLLRKLKTY